MTLISQTAMLQRETSIPDPRYPIRFAHRASRAPIVHLDWQRWVEMGSPDEVKVTVEPLSRAPLVR